MVLRLPGFIIFLRKSIQVAFYVLKIADPCLDLTLYTVPNAPDPRTLIFLNSVSFKILKRAWLGASPLGVRGSTS